MRVFEASVQYNLIHLGDDITVNTPERVVEYLKSAYATYPMQESFWVILLDRKNHAIGRVMISLGTLTSALAHPREIFKPAILASAAAIIVSHNHPSGDPVPSAQDLQVTRLLREASNLLQIPLLDHVIVGYPESDPSGLGHYSFRNSGLL
jgi:DNA repair protein RadC